MSDARSGASLSGVGIPGGQPLLAIPRRLSKAKADSQEWLSYSYFTESGMWPKLCVLRLW